MKKWCLRAGISILVFGAVYLLKPEDNFNWFDIFGMSILATLNITFITWIISLFGLKKYFWRILDIMLGSLLVLYSIGSFI